MRFTIVTVCRNSCELLRPTLESVLRQLENDFEYWVIDGQSSDATVALLREYESRFQGKMRWISEPDHGIFDAMNKGFDRAVGDYVVFINAGDELTPGALTAVSEAMSRTPGGDFYYGIVAFVAQNGRVVFEERISHLHLTDCELHHQGCFVRREIALKYGKYQPELSEHGLHLKLYLGGAIFVPIDQVVARFLLGGDSCRNREQYVTMELQAARQNGLLSAARCEAICRKRLRRVRAEKWIQKLVAFWGRS